MIYSVTPIADEGLLLTVFQNLPTYKYFGDVIIYYASCETVRDLFGQAKNYKEFVDLLVKYAEELETTIQVRYNFEDE